MYSQTWKNIDSVYDKVVVDISKTVGLKINHTSIRTCFNKSLPFGWSHFSVSRKENTQIYHYCLLPCGKKFNSVVNIWRFLSG